MMPKVFGSQAGVEKSGFRRETKSMPALDCEPSSRCESKRLRPHKSVKPVRSPVTVVPRINSCFVIFHASPSALVFARAARRLQLPRSRGRLARPAQPEEGADDVSLRADDLFDGVEL